MENLSLSEWVRNLEIHATHTFSYETSMNMFFTQVHDNCEFSKLRLLLHSAK